MGKDHTGGGLAGSGLGPQELSRYARHIFLEEIGLEGQVRLKRSRVFVVGAGGLGVPLLLYLAAAGVGHISFADGDILELSNLQRQVLYATADVGRRKVEVVFEALRSRNPHIELQPIPEHLTECNALGYIRGYDLVIETTDSFAAKFLVNDACHFSKIPFITAGILRFEGQLLAVDPGRTLCYRCLFGSVPPEGLVPNCSQAGVLGAVAGVVGSMQAVEALKILAEVGESPESPWGRLMIFDLLAGRIRSIRLAVNPHCKLCGESPAIHSLERRHYLPA